MIRNSHNTYHSMLSQVFQISVFVCKKRADKKQPQNVFMSHEDISLFLSVGSVSIFVQDELAQHFCHEDEGRGTGGRLA